MVDGERRGSLHPRLIIRLTVPGTPQNTATGDSNQPAVSARAVPSVGNERPTVVRARHPRKSRDDAAPPVQHAVDSTAQQAGVLSTIQHFASTDAEPAQRAGAIGGHPTAGVADLDRHESEQPVAARAP